MESLVFVLLFTVVVVVWMSEGSQADVSVRQVCSQRVATYGEQVLADVPWPALCSQPVTIPDRGPWSVRLRSDRWIDSGRSRPLLHVN